MSKLDWLTQEIDGLKEQGLYNRIRTIGSAQGAWITVDGKNVLNFCSNNYLGLANHPKIVEAAKEATKKAMKDISGPVIAIALILAAVFVPVGFIPGIVGRLYQQFAITIAVSVLISAFVALSLTPALCSLLLKPSKEEFAKRNWLEKFFAWFNRGFGRMNSSYTRGVGKWIRATPMVLIMLVCLFVGLFFLFNNKPRSEPTPQW